MEQNRFSRQLIVLRAVLPGYSGHARLLRSDSGATMEIRLQTPAEGGNLWLAMVDKTDDGYRAESLGALTDDGRGQASGTFDVEHLQIDPEILAVVLVDESGGRLAMSGFPDGARTVNWADVRAAACDAVTAANPPAAAALPEHSAAPETSDPTAPTAAETAGISPDALWPEEVAALQDEFISAPAVQLFADTRYTFIHIPATDDSPEYYAGIRCSHGIPTHACYAVRGYDRLTPPQGLEDFVWRDGYWTICIDAETGEAVDDR